MKLTKTYKNIEIFAPKRKYNKPRQASAIESANIMKINVNGIILTIENTTDKNIYLRLK